MLKNLREVFEPVDVKLVVTCDSLEKNYKFRQIAYVYAEALEYLLYEPNKMTCVMVMKHKNYLKMMKELQQNGLNLRQNDQRGLTDTVVEYKKEEAA